MDNSDIKCSICGSRLYVTDKCLKESTYHCSSKEAMFWTFNRGSIDESNSKSHWDKSRLEVYSVTIKEE
jgi:hypothetical protein